MVHGSEGGERLSDQGGPGRGDRRRIGVLSPQAIHPGFQLMAGAREVFHWDLWGVLVSYRFSSSDSGSGGMALEVVDWVLWGVLAPP